MKNNNEKRPTGEKKRAAGRNAGIATPRFAAVMASQAVGLLGMEILQFVLPLHLLNLTGSGALYGGVVAAGFVPYTLLAPVGGVIADRTRKRGVMVAVGAALAAAMAACLPLAGTAAVVPATVVVLMLAFAVQALEQPCVQSAIPHLVVPAEVERAVALVNQVGMVTGIGGPVVGGLAFGFFGLAPIVIVCVACFAASAVVAALFVRVPYEPPIRTAGAVATARADLAEALAFLRSSPLMWRTILGATLVNLFGSSFFNVCSPYSVVATSYLQMKSPGTLVGKVMALALMLANFATPLGQLGYGVALGLVSAWAIALLAAGATAVVAAWLANAARA